MKKIKFLKVLVEVSIIGLIILCIFFALKLNPWLYKFADASDKLPQDESFDKLRLAIRFLPILASLKIIIPLLFFLVILFLVRKVLVSIIRDSVFAIKQIMLIRKIAIIYLIFTSILFLISLLRSVFVVLNGKSEVVLKVIASGLASSIGYLITSLIAYVIAEIFLTGFNLKQENELTI